MQNFVFHNPTKILFGRERISEIGKETAAFGENILLVYGRKSIKGTGLYQRVIDSFTDQNITVSEHGGVKSNPLLSHVQKGITTAKQKNIDAIVAVGGGSVIDTAKAISAGVMVNHDVWKFFTGKKSIKKTLPVLTVLTLAASGSEMNSAMVITNQDLELKFGFANRRLYPKVSILDPCLTFSVPPDYTAYGAIDSIDHILEYYFTTEDPETSVQDRFMEGLIINIIENCERAIINPEDYHARAALMWCATLALNGLTAAGLGKVGFPMHLIEHSISALYDTPHGAGLSVVIPGWMTYQSQQRPARFKQFAKRIFGQNRNYRTAENGYGIQRMRAWFQKMGCPVRLHDIAIPATDIPRIAHNATKLGKVWRMPDYDQNKIENVLQNCL